MLPVFIVVGLEGPLQAIWGWGKLNNSCRNNGGASAFSSMFETFDSEGSY